MFKEAQATAHGNDPWQVTLLSKLTLVQLQVILGNGIAIQSRNSRTENKVATTLNFINGIGIESHRDQNENNLSFS